MKSAHARSWAAIVPIGSPPANFAEKGGRTFWVRPQLHERSPDGAWGGEPPMCRFRFAEWAGGTEQGRCRIYLFENKRIYPSLVSVAASFSDATYTCVRLLNRWRALNRLLRLD